MRGVEERRVEERRGRGGRGGRGKSDKGMSGEGEKFPLTWIFKRQSCQLLQVSGLLLEKCCRVESGSDNSQHSHTTQSLADSTYQPRVKET